MPSSLPTPPQCVFIRVQPSGADRKEQFGGGGAGGGGGGRCERGWERKESEKQRTAFCDGGAGFQGLSQQLEALELS